MRLSGQLLDQLGRATVVTVLGGKGAIGKTVISVNLALALWRETGMPVAILDADPEFGDVTVIVPLEQWQSIVNQAAERIIREVLAAYVPPGPPVKAIVEENNCLLKSGRVCPDLPESVTE